MLWGKKKKEVEPKKKPVAQAHKSPEKGKKGRETPKILTAEGWRRLMTKGSFKK